MRFGLVLVLLGCGREPGPTLPPYDELVKKVLLRHEARNPGHEDQWPRPMVGGLGGEPYPLTDALLPSTARWQIATRAQLKAQADAANKDVGFFYATLASPDGGSIIVMMGTGCERPANTLLFICGNSGDDDEWDGRSGTWEFGQNLTLWIE